MSLAGKRTATPIRQAARRAAGVKILFNEFGVAKLITAEQSGCQRFKGARLRQQRAVGRGCAV